MKNFTRSYFYRTNATAEENKQALLDDSVAFALGCTAVSVIQFIFGAISIDLLNFSSLRQVSYVLLPKNKPIILDLVFVKFNLVYQISRIRRMFFETILRQDMTWYDTNTGTNFASTVTEYVLNEYNIFRILQESLLQGFG